MENYVSGNYGGVNKRRAFFLVKNRVFCIFFICKFRSLTFRERNNSLPFAVILGSFIFCLYVDQWENGVGLETR